MRTLFRNSFRILPGALAVAVAGSACSSTPSRPEALSTHPGPIAAKVPSSSIELSYALGRTQRKLLLRSEGTEALGQNLFQKQVLQQGHLEAPQYDGYFLKVEDYCSRHVTQATPALNAPDACRNTYHLVLKRGEQVCQTEGCRSHTAEDAALSHLIREGEFLLARAGSATASNASSAAAPHEGSADSKKP